MFRHLAFHRLPAWQNQSFSEGKYIVIYFFIFFMFVALNYFKNLILKRCLIFLINIYLLKNVCTCCFKLFKKSSIIKNIEFFKLHFIY